MKPSDLITPQMLPPSQAAAPPALLPPAEVGAGGASPGPPGRLGQEMGAEGAMVRKGRLGFRPGSAQDDSQRTLTSFRALASTPHCGGRRGLPQRE